MYSYWGKTKKDHDPEHLQPYHLAVYHNLDVAASAYAILTENPAILQRLADSCGMDTGHFLLWFVFLMSQHDCGKFSERFQGQHKELFRKFQGEADIPPYTLRHDSMGYILWRYVLLDLLRAGEASPLKAVVAHSCECLEVNDDDILDFWSMPVMGHHGKPPTTTSRKNGSNYSTKGSVKQLFSEQAIKDAQLFCLQCVELFNTKLRPATAFQCSEKLPAFLNWDMAGLATLADWLGSDCRSFEYHTEEIPLAEYWDHAVEQARKAVRLKGLLPVHPSGRLSFAELFPSIAVPTPLQRWAEQYECDGSPSLFIIEDVTGSGKTEAALMLTNRIMAAGGGRGLYIALPTMATSNEMFKRLATSYRRLFTDDRSPSLVLAHGAADMYEKFQQTILPLNDEGDGDYGRTPTKDGDESISSECNAWFADSRRKAFLADVGVGTIDQVFLGVLHSKFQALRLFGLGPRVLVVDEVHANDTYMHGILCEALAFHAARGGSALLLSATLPATMRRELMEGFRKGLNMRGGNVLPPSDDTADAPYPLVTVYTAAGETKQEVETRPDVKRTVTVTFHNSTDHIPALILEQANKGRAVCWIRNTVPDAVEAWAALREHLPADRLHLFHARFALCDRQSIEQHVMEMFGKNSTPQQRRGRVLIATQVVEQSLDVDFDILITDLAPVDLVIQRAGRLRRHRRQRDGALITDETTPDKREGDPTLHIVSPEPESDASAGWYAQLFPMAKTVYPNHAELWRTARILKDTGCITMPTGARTLIEAVYGTAAITLPKALADADLRYEGVIGADKTLARTSVLKLHAGYKTTWDNWVDDLKTPTRLGEATTTLRLALYRDGILTPLAGDGKNAWFLSEVRVRRALVTAEGTFTEPLATLVAQTKKGMVDKGRYSVLVPLQEVDGVLRGHAMCDGEPVPINYSSETGLSILFNTQR